MNKLFPLTFDRYLLIADSRREERKKRERHEPWEVWKLEEAHPPHRVARPAPILQAPVIGPHELSQLSHFFNLPSFEL